jgi:hypothetical protein
MGKLLRHPGRTLTPDEFQDPAEAVGESISRIPARALSISEINLNPVSDPQELEFLAGLVPFYGIPSKLLFKLVRVATGLEVYDRWVAVRAIIAKRIPIPVLKPPTKGRQG